MQLYLTPLFSPMPVQVSVLRLLTLAGGHPHLLDSINPIGVQTSALSLNQQYLPAIPADPTAAYLAGQRAGIAAPNIPLLIKLHNGQAGSTQAAELQFGKSHHTVGHGYRPQVPYAPTTSPFHTQGLHLLDKVQDGSNLHSQSSINEKSSTETVVPVEIITKPPSVLSAVAKKHTLVVPQSTSPAPVLPQRLPLATLVQAPEPANMQEELTKVTEDPAPINAHAALDSKLHLSSEEPAEITSGTETTNSASDETQVSSNTLPYALLRNDPFLMYRLPSAGAPQGESHFVIMVPHHSASLTSGKQKGVTVYLAKDVRVLKPHHHRELGLGY